MFEPRDLDYEAWLDETSPTTDELIDEMFGAWKKEHPDEY